VVNIRNGYPNGSYILVKIADIITLPVPLLLLPVSIVATSLVFGLVNKCYQRNKKCAHLTRGRLSGMLVEHDSIIWDITVQ